MARKRKSVARETVREVDLNGRRLRYAVRVSRRARRARIQVWPGRVLVVLPWGMRVAYAEDMLKAKASWVTRKLEEFALRERRDQLLDSGGRPRLLLFGKWLHLEVAQNGRRSGPAVRVEDGRLVVLWPHGQPVTANRLIQQVEAWYRLQAKDFLGRMLKETATRMGLECPALTIRGQKTLWGSFSVRSGVSLNWKLLMAPEKAIRSVVVHELSHVYVRNHSPRFWAVVQRYCPDYRQHRRWLDENGHLVQRLATFDHVREALSKLSSN